MFLRVSSVVGKSLRVVMNLVLLSWRIVKVGSHSHIRLNTGIRRSLVVGDDVDIVGSGRREILKFVWKNLIDFPFVVVSVVVLLLRVLLLVLSLVVLTTEVTNEVLLSAELW